MTETHYRFDEFSVGAWGPRARDQTTDVHGPEEGGDRAYSFNFWSVLGSWPGL
jgi:hypothetical protein